MESLQVDILNPKASQLLKALADLNLISIKEIKKDDNFLTIVKRIRTKAKKNPPGLAKITNEVESVRAKRYGKTKR